MVKYTTPLKESFLNLILIFYVPQHYTFRVLQLHIGWLNRLGAGRGQYSYVTSAGRLPENNLSASE